MVLVGIGEEFGESMDKGKAIPQLAECFQAIEKNERQSWMLPYLEKLQGDWLGTEKTAKAYETLELFFFHLHNHAPFQSPETLVRNANLRIGLTPLI